MTETELLYTIGVGLGGNIDQILELTTDDIVDESISLHVGPLHIRRTYLLPADIKETLQSRSGKIFNLSRDDAMASLDILDFLPLTMQRYYDETGDIYYPMHIFGIEDEEHALAVIGR